MAEKGKTIFISTHQLDEAEELCDRCSTDGECEDVNVRTVEMSAGLEPVGADPD